jgi:MoaA/NifB/PqqE/SkfB family radical SAM enzyme
MDNSAKAKPVELPSSYNYIGAFLTFRCPYRCSYCINRYDVLAPRTGELAGAAWIDFFSRLDVRDVPITLQGGEPGAHPDFVDIVARTLETHQVDILTNLAFDLNRFMDRVSPEKINRVAPYAPIRVSYHPEQFSIEHVLERLLTLQDHGYRIGLYGVLHPEHLEVVKAAARLCADKGVDFRTKPFLGWYKGKLYGEYAYEAGVAKDGVMQQCECAPSELLIAPNGDIHRCHGYLYSGLNPLANIVDQNLYLSDNHLECNRFGSCNPCDVKIKNNRFQQFGHVATRIRNIRPMGA